MREMSKGIMASTHSMDAVSGSGDKDGVAALAVQAKTAVAKVHGKVRSAVRVNYDEPTIMPKQYVFFPFLCIVAIAGLRCVCVCVCVRTCFRLTRSCT